MKRLAILGSTGSIGTQALEVADFQSDIKIVALSANSNVKLLSEQARKFNPDVVCIGDSDKYKDLKIALSDTNVKVCAGENNLSYVSTHPDADLVLTSVVGNVGLKPTVDAIKCGKRILLANKETLVTGGEFIMPMAKGYNSDIIPVDSEHCAIFQCLKSGKESEVDKILLTCSGGPFYGKTVSQLRSVRACDALKHPNWNMGSKITVDSATLMNKGLEFIEARWLFDVAPENIEIYIHRQSIVHSMVEYKDGSVIAQMGVPDMKLPIQYAINYPDRYNRMSNRLNLYEVGELTFAKPDYDTFKCLGIAIESLKKGGIIPAVMNAANEVAVEYFLNDKINFCQIPQVISEVVSSFDNSDASLDSVLCADKEARLVAKAYIERM